MPARPHVVDPKVMTDLIFAARLCVPTRLCAMFSLNKPRSIFSTLETTLGH